MESAPIRRVAVYCGSSSGTNPSFVNAATATGRELARRGLELVYGGGRVGLMGAVANAALEAGGTVHGVITTALLNAEVGHGELTTLEVLATMHDRKARMAELADAFLALPGGFGTFDELFEVLTWTQLGIHHKPIALLNVDGYWDFLLQHVEHATNVGFVHPHHGELLRQGVTAYDALEQLLLPLPPPSPKWR